MTEDWLIEPAALKTRLDAQNLLLLDIRTEEEFGNGHLPGALQLSFERLLKTAPPVGGLLPDSDVVTEIFQSLGLNENSWVVCYDGAFGAAASRVIWTLNAYGIKTTSLLNGGINAWQAEGFELTTDARTATVSTITLERDGTTVIDAETLKSRLTDPNLARLDARTLQEHMGTDVRSKHGGRIPGAVHFEWTDSIDQQKQGKLLPKSQLTGMLKERNIGPEKDVIVYCQTHHRSSLSYVMLKHLGYKNVVALDGAWSNWGNRDDVPIEKG